MQVSRLIGHWRKFRRGCATDTLAIGSWSCLLFAVSLCGHAWADRIAPASSQTAEVEPNQQAMAVVKIFEAKCDQCHSPDSGIRPAIKHWADSRDLTELVKRYVEPNERTAAGYKNTTLWHVLTDDPKQRMPPLKSTGGQLTTVELETIGQWIATGAPADLSVPQLTQHVASSPSVELGFFQQLQRWLGKLHPAMVHVPIGLLLAAAVAELLWWLTDRDPFDFACRFCTVVGAVGAIPAAAVGWMAGSFESDISYTLLIHRWMGITVAFLAVVTAGMSVVKIGQPLGQPMPRFRKIRRWLVLINAILVGVASHLGGELVHGYNHFAW